MPQSLRAGDEHRRNIDGTAAEYLKLRAADALRAASVPLQAALEADAFVFTAVNTQFTFRQPTARRDRLRRTAFPSRRSAACPGPDP